MLEADPGMGSGRGKARQPKAICSSSFTQHRPEVFFFLLVFPIFLTAKIVAVEVEVVQRTEAPDCGRNQTWAGARTRRAVQR